MRGLLSLSPLTQSLQATPSTSNSVGVCVLSDRFPNYKSRAYSPRNAARFKPTTTTTPQPSCFFKEKLCFRASLLRRLRSPPPFIFPSVGTLHLKPSLAGGQDHPYSPEGEELRALLGQGARANRGDGMWWARHNPPVASARSSVSPQAPKGAAASFSAAVVYCRRRRRLFFTHPPSRLLIVVASDSQLTGLESRLRVLAWILLP